MSGVKPNDLVIRNIGGGDVQIILVGEKCNNCDEHVHYWNDPSRDGTNIGNASCGCTAEGPEVCEPIVYGELGRAMLGVALAQLKEGK